MSFGGLFYHLLEYWAGLAGTIWPLASQPGSYVSWAKILAVGGLPAAVLAVPIFRSARKGGFAKGLRALLWPIGFALAWLMIGLPLVGAFADKGLKFALAFLTTFIIGFTMLAWLPVAFVAAGLGASRRKANKPETLFRAD